MYCVIKCIVRGNQAHVKNADLRHPSCTVVMYRHKSASPVHNVLRMSEQYLYFHNNFMTQIGENVPFIYVTLKQMYGVYFEETSGQQVNPCN